MREIRNEMYLNLLRKDIEEIRIVIDKLISENIEFWHISRSFGGYVAIY